MREQAPSKEEFAVLLNRLESAAAEYGQHQGGWEADRLVKARQAVVDAYSGHEPPADEQIDHAIRRIEECELSMDDSEGLVAMLTELKQRRAAQPPGALPPKVQAIVDAAIAWSYCPDAGGFRDGPAVEDTVEQLDMAVHNFTGSEAVSPEYPNHWTLDEMRAALTKEVKPGCACPPGGWNPYCRTHITPHTAPGEEVR